MQIARAQSAPRAEAKVAASSILAGAGNEAAEAGKKRVEPIMGEAKQLVEGVALTAPEGSEAATCKPESGNEMSPGM